MSTAREQPSKNQPPGVEKRQRLDFGVQRSHRTAAKHHADRGRDGRRPVIAHTPFGGGQAGPVKPRRPVHTRSRTSRNGSDSDARPAAQPLWLQSGREHVEDATITPINTHPERLTIGIRETRGKQAIPTAFHSPSFHKIVAFLFPARSRFPNRRGCRVRGSCGGRAARLREVARVDRSGAVGCQS